MRTKTLFLSAAALAAGLFAASAQVYSVNVVGYVNVNLTNGFTMFANPLDLDGSGTNNTVHSVFGTNLPAGSTVYAFSGGAFASPAAQYSAKGGWGGGTNAVNSALNPGGGVFVSLPSAKTITLVGNVKQGALATPYVSGYNIISSQVPQSGQLQTDLGYVPTAGDAIYEFNPATQNYVAPVKGFAAKGGWQNGQPIPKVGDAFWLNSASASGGTWSRNFTVQ